MMPESTFPNEADRFIDCGDKGEVALRMRRDGVGHPISLYTERAPKCPRCAQPMRATPDAQTSMTLDSTAWWHIVCMLKEMGMQAPQEGYGY